MNRLRSLFRWVVPEKDELSIAAHERVLSAVDGLAAFMPTEYEPFNLPHIIRPKAADYHTGLDGLYDDFCHLTASLQGFLHHPRTARQVAYRLSLLRRRRLARSYREYEDETSVSWERLTDPVPSRTTNTPCNLLVANLQTYLRVMVLYLQNSELNNLLVIPRSFADVSILKEVDRSKILYFDDFVTPEIRDRYLSAQCDFSELFARRRDELRELFVFDSYDFFPLVEGGLRNVFSRAIPHAVLVYLTVDEILSRIDVSALIGARVRRVYDRAFYTCAAAHGIPRFVLLHSNIGSHVRFLHKMGHFNDLTGVFAWGPLQQELIQRDRFSDALDVHVTGSPLFVRPTPTNTQDVSTRGSRIIYACTASDLPEVRLLTKLVHTRFDDIELVVKVHPGHDHRRYERYCGAPNIRLVSGKVVVEELLTDGDVLITTISESSLQSMLRGIPTLYLSIKDKWKPELDSIYGFSTEEARALIVKDGRTLHDRLVQLLRSADDRAAFLDLQQRFLAKRIRVHARPDGPARAIDRIIRETASRC